MKNAKFFTNFARNSTKNAHLNRFMRFIILTVISSLFFLAAKGQKEEKGLPHFSRITAKDGLHDDDVLHILQLNDGRMAVTNYNCINIIDGDSIRQIPFNSPQEYRISNYHGAYHVYADEKANLWVKEWGNAWCINLETGNAVDLTTWKMTDLFVDSYHHLWTVNDTLVDGRIAYQSDWGELQDLDTDTSSVYLFFSTGRLACYDRNSNSLKYTSEPYDTTEAKFYDKTSLVVKGANDCFYQLRCGKERNIFLCFNPHDRKWQTVFETKNGIFHSLCVPDSQTALIGCPKGIWQINLESGEMTLNSELTSTDGDTLRTGINAVVYDRKGGLWLGCYHEGILHSDTLYAPVSHTTLYIILALILSVLLILFFFWRYALRQRQRERKLMSRLRELFRQTLDAEKDGTATNAPDIPDEMAKEEDESPENSAFLIQAAALVKQNINTPGYTVERLAADLCMERTGLYKKLTGMLDKTPTLFIRSIRMEHAAELLKEGNLSISEIASRVGYSSSSYFSKHFQEAFGCKPSEYLVTIKK